MAVKIFFCYAHEDEALLKKLKTHLRSLQRRGYIDIWHDRDINAGAEWEREISEHLNAAQIILLLVSPDFMDSDYCYSKEMLKAMELHEQGEARVIPVILRASDWEETPISKLQILPKDALPIAKWVDHDEAFLDIVKGVERAVKTLLVERLLKEAQKERYDNALGIYEQAIKTDKSSALPYIDRGDTYCKHKEYEKALVDYKQALLHNPPDTATLHKSQGMVLLELKRYSESLEAFEMAIGLNPQDALAYTYQGYLLSYLDRYDDALIACERAVQLDPTSALAYYIKSSVLARLQRNEEALKTYQQIYNLEPTNAVGYLSKGDALYDLKHYKDALEAYEQARQLDSDNAAIYYGKGKTQQALEDYTSALVSYNQVIERDPKHAQAYANKGFVLEQLAQEAYAKAQQQGFVERDAARSGQQKSIIKSQGFVLLYTLYDQIFGQADKSFQFFLTSDTNNKAAKVWDLQSGQQKLVISDVGILTVSGDGNILISTRPDGTIQAWDISRGVLLSTLIKFEENTSDTILGYMISNDGQKLAVHIRENYTTYSDGTGDCCYLYETHTGRQLLVPIENNATISLHGMSADSQLLSYSFSRANTENTRILNMYNQQQMNLQGYIPAKQFLTTSDGQFLFTRMAVNSKYGIYQHNS